jgi:putative Mg2+ transporter-C (MgtC) family protein
MISLLKLIIDIILAVILAGIIGYERQVRRGVYSAGIRTHILLCLSSMIITLISVYNFPADPARIIAAMITAVGFIAAGTAISTREEIKGLTTGIGLFAVSSVGMLIALEYYLISIILTVFLWTILESWRLEVKLGYKKK